MNISTYAPGTEYLLILNNGSQMATGGFEDVQSLHAVVRAMWDNKQEGSIITWTADKRSSWTSIDTYECIFNPDSIVAILDLRDSGQVHKIV